MLPERHPDQWQRWNSRSILLMKYFLDPIGKTKEPYGTMGFCRPLRSFLHRGIRMYAVRMCSSMTGVMNGPIYVIPWNMLERTRMKRLPKVNVKRLKK